MTTIPTEVLFADVHQTKSDAPLENPQLAILKQHFPNCFDKNGAFLPEKLTEFVQASDTPINKEAYSLQWLGKSYAKLLRDLPPQTLLCEDKQHNNQEDNKNSQNLLIKGDNLEVLKHLKNAYNEKVKMIYIDPPYNTGSDGFVYQDDRKFSKDQLAELTGMSLDEAERVLKFTDKKSNSHSAWLTFMYPRLYIARTLLQQDGVIFISIDDNEVAQLRLLCDEVFGEENFVGQFIHKNNSSKNQAKLLSVSTEYFYCYAKDIYKLQSNYIWRLDKKGVKDIAKLFNKLKKEGITLDEINNEVKELYKRPKYAHLSRWNKVDESGVFKDADLSREGGSKNYTIINPHTGKECLIPKRGWGKSYEELLRLQEENLIWYGDENTPPSMKDYINVDDKSVPDNFWYYDNSTDTRNIKNLFGFLAFENPKPVEMIKNIMQLHLGKNDLILDFFAGSGTTADAVMQLNAEDGGNRQFILVQLPEPIDPKKSKTAYDFVKNELDVVEPTVFDITKERIIRSAKKILNENDVETGHALSVQGFKIYETVDNFCLTTDEELSPNQEMFPKQSLTDKQYQTLLTSWRLHDGNRLTDGVSIKKLADYTAYLCDKNLYLLHPNFNSDSIKDLIECLDKEPNFTPNRIIFYGEHIDSGKQKELQQALDSYANKKDLKISLLARY